MSKTFTVDLLIAGQFISVDVHQFPHRDETSALVAVEDHGTEEFLDTYCSNGRLRLGVNGGPFDEHPDQSTGDARKKGCCVTLVAEALDLQKTAPWWNQTLEFCHFKETGQPLDGFRCTAIAASHPLDPYAQLRSEFRVMRYRAQQKGREATNEEQLAIIRADMERVRVELEDQKSFHRAVIELRSKAQVETINGPFGKKLRLVVIESDEWAINNAARAILGADFVVQKNSSGHIHIFTKNDKREVMGELKHDDPSVPAYKLDDLAQAIKRAEQEAESEVREDNWYVLRKEGRFDDQDNWHYGKTYGQLHNGTENHDDYLPTLLTLEQIVGLIKLCMDTQLFAYKDCQPNNCRYGACTMYSLGCTRCRSVRGKKYAERQEEQGKVAS